MKRGFLYLVAIMGWFTRKVLAIGLRDAIRPELLWWISNTCEAEFCVEAFNETVHRFGAPEIMNSHQDSQFTSFVWTDRMTRAGTWISMDVKSRGIDNILIKACGGR